MPLSKLRDLTAYAICIVIGLSLLTARVEANDPNEPQTIYGKEFGSALREKSQVKDENWQQKAANFFYYHTFTNEFIVEIFNQAKNSNASFSCVDDVVTMSILLTKLNLSALQMVDAWGKPPSGILNGALSLFGSYDECLAIKLIYKQHEIKGKYCPVTSIGSKKNESEISTKEPKETDSAVPGLSLSLGTCFPSSCNEEDVQNILNVALDRINMEAQVAPCSVDEPLKWKADQIVVLVILIIFGTIMAVATTADGVLRLHEKNRKENDYTYQPAPHGRAVQALLCFSVYTNSKKIFDVSSATQGRSIRVLHGMRFFSIAWVVLGHSYLSIDLRLPANLLALFTSMTQNAGFQVVISGTVSVDTFFFMSGLLVAYVALPELQKLKAKNKRFNFIMFYFHRYWRLTPALAMVIAITIIWERFGSGPLWNNSMQENCRKNWWTNLLYINNFKAMNDMCVGQSWYLANDFQFHLIAPLFLLLLFWNAYVGIAVTSAVMLASIITTGVITVVNHFPPTFVFPALTVENALQFFDDVYIKPYCRISPYCVGILTGYILRRYPNLRLKRHVLIIGWLVAGATLLAIVFIPYKWNKGTPIGDPEDFIFAAFHRALWAAGLSWVVIASATGHGGVINEFLSWRAFIPLSRLSYMVYLVHPLVVAPYYQNEKLPIYFSHYYVLQWFLSMLVLSFMLAFLCSLAFEAPFVGLERIFLRGGRIERKQNLDPPLIQNEEVFEKDAAVINDEDEATNEQVDPIDNVVSS